MFKIVRIFGVAAVLSAAVVGDSNAEPVKPEHVKMTSARYAPISVNALMTSIGEGSGAEIKLAHPQGHQIQLLQGGGVRLSIWSGSGYFPKAFTVVRSRVGSRVCIDRTRHWAGGCLEFSSNGNGVRCRYLWNNGAGGEVGCDVRPIGYLNGKPTTRKAGLPELDG